MPTEKLNREMNYLIVAEGKSFGVIHGQLKVKNGQVENSISHARFFN